MFAYIPARIGSKRIPKKNIRLLDGKPLIVHVIESISRVEGIQGIAVSTDSNEINDIVKSIPLVTTLGLRRPDLATDTVPFRELIKLDIPRYRDYFKNDNILFSTATCALIDTNTFQKGVDMYIAGGSHGLVISVSPYETSAYLMLTQEPNDVKMWFPDEYLRPTKDLKRTYYDNGSFCIFNYHQFEQTKSLHTLMDLKPVRILPISPDIGIDLDNESDWERLTYFYQKMKKRITLPEREF